MARYENEILELRQRVAKLERQMALLLQQQGISFREERNLGASPEVVELMRRGRKIEAIKVYREETGVGLKEAKEFVESLGL